MYPFLRVGLDLWLYRNKPLEIFGTHSSTHRIRLSDMDVFAELNNGRALSIYDIGRITLAQRCGLLALLRREKWGLTLAGTVVQFRKRVRAFDKVEIRARMLGWDARFVYLEHAMFRGGEATSHLVVRAAITDRNGLVPTARVLAAYGHDGASPELPDWVKAWSSAEALRPWPPLIGS